MGNPIKGLKHFHVCSNGSCKRSGFYATKQGNAYCDKCTIKYIEKYGISDFWPQYERYIMEIYDQYKGFVK